MTLSQFATPRLVKVYVEEKVTVSYLMSITPPASFDTLFKIYSGCVYVTNAGNCSITMREVIMRAWPENLSFWGVVLVQVQLFGTGTRYDIKIWQQFGKRVKTKSEKILKANFYF